MYCSCIMWKYVVSGLQKWTFMQMCNLLGMTKCWNSKTSSCVQRNMLPASGSLNKLYVTSTLDNADRFSNMLVSFTSWTHHNGCKIVHWVQTVSRTGAVRITRVIPKVMRNVAYLATLQHQTIEYRLVGGVNYCHSFEWGMASVACITWP